MNNFWGLIPNFLIKIISNYSFPKKFFFGSLVISIPLLIFSTLTFFYFSDQPMIQVVLVLFSIGLLVVLYLFFGAVYISVVDAIQQLQKASNKWKDGELKVRVNINTNDELKEIGTAFNKITAAFEEEIDEHKAIRFVIEQSLKKNAQLITAINSLDIGVIITEPVDKKNKVIYANPGFKKITGYSEAEIVGKGLSILQGEKTSSATKIKLKEAIEKEKKITVEILNYHKNGNDFWNHLTITPVYNQESQLTNHIGIMTDITKQKNADLKIYELAYFDSLTNLSNINYMKEYVSQQLNVGITNYAIFYIDIDRFKNLNSRLGSKVGDIVLQQYAHRIKETLKTNNGLLARAAKDEFIVFVPYTGKKETLEKLSYKIMNSVSKPFTVKQYEFFLQTSIGVSRYPEDNLQLEQLIQYAETAMNEAKLNGISKIINYHQSMSTLHREAHVLESELKFAIERNELKLVYQPKISITTGEIVGAEALVRWEHPTRGLISPMKFIPIAESTGLIFNLGNWVIKEACKKKKLWIEEGLGDFKISINISAKQFIEEYFIPLMEDILNETDLDPKYIEIELTESALHDELKAQKLLSLLEEKNIAVAIDDFGTGYSSLSYLRTLPIETLKIDRSFIIDMEISDRTCKLLKSIISMAHSLNLNVIAEGVETPFQLLKLKEMGCNEIQGYLVSKPLFEDDFEHFLKTFNSNLILDHFNKVR